MAGAADVQRHLVPEVRFGFDKGAGDDAVGGEGSWLVTVTDCMGNQEE
jgi:hypothetical protein